MGSPVALVGRHDVLTISSARNWTITIQPNK